MPNIINELFQGSKLGQILRDNKRRQSQVDLVELLKKGTVDVPKQETISRPALEGTKPFESVFGTVGEGTPGLPEANIPVTVNRPTPVRQSPQYKNAVLDMYSQMSGKDFLTAIQPQKLDLVDYGYGKKIDRSTKQVFDVPTAPGTPSVFKQYLADNPGKTAIDYVREKAEAEAEAKTTTPSEKLYANKDGDTLYVNIRDKESVKAARKSGYRPIKAKTGGEGTSKMKDAAYLKTQGFTDKEANQIAYNIRGGGRKAAEQKLILAIMTKQQPEEVTDKQLDRVPKILDRIFGKEEGGKGGATQRPPGEYEDIQQSIGEPASFEETGTDIQKRFSEDSTMKGYTLGTKTDKGYEVKDKTGKLIGHYQ